MTVTKISIGGVKTARNSGAKVITANQLTDGSVVYRTAGGEWVSNLNAAQIVEGNDALKLLEQASLEEHLIVGPYLMDILQSNETVLPAGRSSHREQIRASGPTVTSSYMSIS